MRTILVQPADQKKVENLNDTCFYEKDIDHQVGEDFRVLLIRNTDLWFVAKKDFLTAEQLKQYVVNNYFREA